MKVGMPVGIGQEFGLRLVDAVVVLLLLTPLTILWWAGTWQLLDIYLYPPSQWISSWISLLLGYLICIVLWYLNPLIVKILSPDRIKMRAAITLAYNYGYSFGYINIWRGLWGATDIMVKQQEPSQQQTISIVLLAFSLILLILLRASGNTLSFPFTIGTELGFSFRLARPRFRSQLSSCGWYSADVIVTLVLINTLVVQVWRGVWTLTTQALSPDNQLHAHALCAIIGVSACVLLMALNYPIYLLAKRLADIHPWLEYMYEVFMNMLVTVAGLLVWVACWQTLREVFLFKIAWRGAVFHIAGFLGLVALQASSTLVPIQTAVDGEIGQGYGVWWHIEYVTSWVRWYRLRHITAQVAIIEASVSDAQPIIQAADDQDT